MNAKILLISFIMILVLHVLLNYLTALLALIFQIVPYAINNPYLLIINALCAIPILIIVILALLPISVLLVSPINLLFSILHVYHVH